MARSKVAVLRVSPETILDDLDRLHELADVRAALAPGAQTILKDNISWHFPFPGANTTPWQLEGTARALRARGYDDLVCVQNKTVVTDAFKGEDLNGYVPIFQAYDIPVRYNFKPEDMSWSVYKPTAKMNVLDRIFPEGILIPDAFHGTNIVHLPTTKCVAGDTQVILADGTPTTIREVVRGQLERAAVVHLEHDGTTHCEGSVELFAMDAQGAVRPFHAIRFAKTQRAGRRVVRLRTRTGRQLVATGCHPLFTPSGWRPTGELAAGDRVAIARRITVSGRPQPLPQTHAAATPSRVVARAGRKYTAEFNQQLIDGYQGGATVTALAAKAEVRWQTVQAILRQHDIPLRRNVVPLAVPATTSPAFWRWLGYLTAEGCIESLESGAGKIWFTNTLPEIREDFIALTRTLFGMEARDRGRGQVSIYGRDLVRFLEELGLSVPLNAGNKRVPDALFRCGDADVAAFLSGYLDGDGHVVTKQAEVSATTKSPFLARDLQLLFARLGVVAFTRPVERTIPGVWSEPRTYHQVVVSGAAVLDLASYLDLKHPGKRALLASHAARLLDSKQPSDLQGRFAGPIAEMRRLVSDDLAWDEVVAIEDVPEEMDLYDVTVPGADSFVADGIVAHNCHIYTTTTGAMKNAFGGLLNTKRHYTHSWIHETLVDLLAIQKEIHSGLFAVMDGTTAGDGPGPRTMRPVIKNVMLASADQVAIDAVAAAMMGFDPMSLDYIRIADEQGLGHGRREDIEVVGDAHLADERWGFSVGDNGASMIGDIMWFGPLKRFQKLFFHTPLVNLFVMGSEAYHDYYRWPLKDRKVFEGWLESTPWGQLFAHYRARGTLEGRGSAAVGEARA
jgi:intein/homing endonuclease/uncharacterized protein (DUF362 family)